MIVWATAQTAPFAFAGPRRLVTPRRVVHDRSDAGHKAETAVVVYGLGDELVGAVGNVRSDRFLTDFFA